MTAIWRKREPDLANAWSSRSDLAGKFGPPALIEMANDGNDHLGLAASSGGRATAAWTYGYAMGSKLDIWGVMLEQRRPAAVSRRARRPPESASPRAR